MNTTDKMAEVRERFSLPEPGATHQCRATKHAEGTPRAAHLGKDHPCYVGQWAIHGAHDYQVRVQNWLGGGDVMVHCPGKTPETVLGR